MEAELLHATLQLARRRTGVLHRQGREGTQSGGMAGYMLAQNIVGPARDRERLFHIGNTLDAGRVEGEDGERSAAFLHALQALLLDVQKSGFEPLPEHRWSVNAR